MTTGTSHALHVTGLSKSFGTTRVLDEVCFTVEPGRFLVLLGPSGSGKTTLLRCLAGIERADTGTIRLGDRTLAEGHTHLPPDRRELAMVFQDYALWPHMTAAANVAYALRRRKPTREQSVAKATEVLERVGLADHGDRYPHQLSGGQQQRVALARALVAEPSLLLFDEPLSNLDADLRERLRVQIAALTRESGATVVYITHDQAEAFALADTVGVLEQGRLVQLAAPEDVYHRPSTPFVARFTGLAGELTGQTTGPARSARVTVRTDAGELRAAVIAGTEFTTGERVQVLLRPAALGFDDDKDPTTASTEHGALTGVVTDTAFRGRGYDHVVELPGGTRLTGLFHRRAHTLGTTVRITIDPDGCFAYPAPAPADAGPAQPDIPTRTLLEIA